MHLVQSFNLHTVETLMKKMSCLAPQMYLAPFVWQKKKILVTASSQEETTKRILKFETLVRVQYLVCRLEGLEERVSVKKKKNFSRFETDLVLK